MSVSENAAPRLYNSRIPSTYIKLVRGKYGYIDINELLRSAGIEPHQVEDEGHWFTQEQINRFHEQLQILTGNKNIAREAGLYSASPGDVGGIKQYILGLASPATAYGLMGKFAGKVIRSSTYHSKKIGPCKVEIKVTANAGVREEPFQCENRKGYLEAFSKLFNYKLPRIEHPECMFKGGSCCRYIVSWQKSPSDLLKKIRNIALPALAGLSLWSVLVPELNTMAVVLGSVSLISILGWYAEYLNSRELGAAVTVLGESSDKLFEQINQNYDNALMINEVGQALNMEADIDGVLDKICVILEKRLDYDRGLFMLANHAGTRLSFRTGYGHTDEQLAIIKKIAFHLDKAESRGIFTVAFKEQRAVLMNDIDDYRNVLSPRSREFARRLGVKALICCPIIYGDKSRGVLAVDNVKTKRPLLQQDMNLLMGVAAQVGSRLHSLMLEVQLRQTQKLEAVGSLAGGIAHDFNNLLTTILGYSELITRKLPPDHPLLHMAEAIHQDGQRAADLTRQLLAFSRKQVMEMKVSNLNLIINDTARMLGRLIGEDIALELFPAEKIGNIMADVSQVEQILMNLVVNARDAMPNGGHLTIETAEVILDQGYTLHHQGVKPGAYVVLIVTDTGEGISPEVQEKIFEPFFTTKMIGKGTGLGLSTIYGIVRQHNGHIYVYSEPGKGTTFKIYLPVVKRPLEKTEKIETREMPAGTETLLIVDDDPAVRNLVFDTLAPLGYTLMSAASGEEALDLCSSTSSRIDLVLSDVVMPGMNGLRMIEQLKRHRPEMKAVLMSGYTDNIVVKRGVLKPGIIFISKPLQPVALANKLRTVLDNAT
ncbi:MAG: ATP-binding protein [Desulfobacterales bacterium]|nr:ATP-binding protein [Desulfobacterales bacterium]